MGAAALTPLGAEALSSGFNFLGNLGGSVSGGLFGANQARKNRKFQERMYKQQVEDNIAFWNMQQEYNLPSAQLARLRDAGLSGLLMYGEGGISGNIAGQAPDSATAPHGAQASASSFNTRIDLANLALVQAQADNLRADSELKRQEAGKTQVESDSISFDLAFRKDAREIDMAQRSATYDLTKSMELLNREQRYYYRDQCRKLSSEIDSIVSDMENKKAMTAAQINDINTRLNKYLEEFPHMIANLDSQTRKNYADALASTVAARYQQKLIDSGYIEILAGHEGQQFLNAIKYGDALTIENGLRGLEFLSKPDAGSWQYKTRNFFDYVLKPSVEVLEDAAIGAGSVYFLKGTGGKMGKIGFVK